MKFETLGILILSSFFPIAAQAQNLSPAELAGARFDSPANRVVDSNASFAVGLSLDGGASFSDSARLSDTVNLIGRVRPEPEHVGLKADIFVVDRVNLVFMMLDPDGLFQPWNGRVPDLVPFLEQVTLTQDLEVEIFSGSLGASGDHRIFLGYLPEGGNLHYTPLPHRVDITEASAAEQAFGLFESAVSPDIIGSRCIECHVRGGLADGRAFHIFRQPLESSLQTNFEIFRDLVALRGVSYILTKVQGGNAHEGGVQLTSGGRDYETLEEFLNLVAQHLSSQGQAPPQDSGDDDPYEDPYQDPYSSP